MLGDPNQRELNRYRDQVDEINSLEKQLEKKTDTQLKEESLKLKRQLSSAAAEIYQQTRDIPDQHELNDQRREHLANLLEGHKAYAFALVREAAKRQIGQRHFDVQLLGGLVLHEGKIAEMKTGEGKTLVASLPLYLNGLTGLGAQLVTVNDYLARLGAGWMSPIYSFLGMSVGVIGPQASYIYDSEFQNEEPDWRLRHLKPVSRKEAYQADIVYGTNSEFGFDYLRDNMAQRQQDIVQRELVYAIIDEVDSILIDEARTPLIISAPASRSADSYAQFAGFVKRLSAQTDYTIDEKARSVSLTPAGINKIERLAGVNNIYDPSNVRLVHYLDESLKAAVLYKKNRDYVVKNDEVLIVDEFTGRILAGRRYSGGLHQAIEAKEGVSVKEESVTLATITFQNYFRIYTKIAGMTGTAVTEAEEFAKIYHLEVVIIPPNRPCQRIDWEDEIYRTEEAKLKAIISAVQELHQNEQPVLIGTISITKSEKLSRLLKAAGLKHSVLNAKQHQREGEVIAQAGQPGAVTVATNMAGRGVDIILGGTTPTGDSTAQQTKDWQKRHEKIIESGGLFVIGTERHESRRIDNQLRGRAGRQGDPGASRFFLSMEDDLMRIFGGERMKSMMERLRIPDDMSIKNKIITRAIEQSQVRVEGYNFDTRKQLLEYDDVINKHREAIYRRRTRALCATTPEDFSALHDELVATMSEEQQANYQMRSSAWPEDLRQEVEKHIVLRTIDAFWVEHLETMDALKESIGLRGYGQREPIVEYKQEAFHLFRRLQESINSQIVMMLLKVEISSAQPSKKIAEDPASEMMRQASQDRAGGEATKKIGRNDPCPCGSGKKYKKCHGL